MGIRKLGRQGTLRMMTKLHLLLFVVAFAVSSSVARGQPKDSCPGRCGDVTIPYPFGTTKGCYLNEEFFITCNSSGVPFLGKSSIPVLNISLLGEIRLAGGVSSICYDGGGKPTYNYRSWISPSKHTLSKEKNMFTVVGCDTYAFIESTTYSIGCIPRCKSTVDTPSAKGSCHGGEACCQTYIPSGIQDFNVTISSPLKFPPDLAFTICSYAFVVEDGYFDFSVSDITSLSSEKLLPVVFDWSIGNQTCKQVGNTSVCSKNSKCVDSNKGHGYNCKCWKGYDGNPYLPNGCQDTDECAQKKHKCARTAVCINTNGSFECHCPKGYHGDPTTECTRKRLNWTIILLGTGLGLGLLFLIIGTWGLYKFLRKQKKINRRKQFFKRNGGLLLQQQIKAADDNTKKTRIFSSKELGKATDKFSQDRILGQGGQGTVYKGMLADGKIVAIKKSKAVDEDNLQDFINEVVILSQINHRNIVKLFGCCLETKVPILVYEFVPNGNLFEHLDGQFDDFPMTWEVRLRIAIEAAGALSYLHSTASIPIYHRDIKSTNILLDGKYRAKVSDFGTSRSITIDQTHLTTVVSGTTGYIDPEYFQSSQFTDKSDVYSFGVVLVELITGEKPISLLRSEKCRGLATHFINSMRENKLFDIIDARIKNDVKPEEAIAVANLAKRCLNLNGRKRPTMREISIELERTRSSPNDSKFQIQSIKEDKAIEIDIGDSWDVVHTAPSAFDIDATSSLDVEPLVPLPTW